ncbi:MAG: hypothetical protein Q4C42_11450 [Clostridia bacterium]|nr:hypothetical protein [Clostridia bacterium]
MSKVIHPCDLCDRRKDCWDCVWHTLLAKKKCDSYDCMFYYEDGCLHGFDEKCGCSKAYVTEEDDFEVESDD